MPAVGHVRASLKRLDKRGFVKVEEWDHCCPVCEAPTEKSGKGWGCTNGKCWLMSIKYDRHKLYEPKFKSTREY